MARCVLGYDPVREPLEVKRRVGYLPDSVGFYDNLTAAENLRYTGRLIGSNADEREERIAGALDHVGSSTSPTSRVGTFSRGMRQRLGLAEILMKEAADRDPGRADLRARPAGDARTARHHPQTQARGVTVLLSSHLLDRVQSVCDRVALFNQGKIALIGTVGELGRQVLGGGYNVEVEAEGPGSPIGSRAFPAYRGRDDRPATWRLLADRDVRPEAAAQRDRGGGELLRLSVEEPSLEDDLHPLLPEHSAQRESAMRREGSPCTASAS